MSLRKLTSLTPCTSQRTASLWMGGVGRWAKSRAGKHNSGNQWSKACFCETWTEPQKWSWAGMLFQRGLLGDPVGCSLLMTDWPANKGAAGGDGYTTEAAGSLNAAPFRPLFNPQACLLVQGVLCIVLVCPNTAFLGKKGWTTSDKAVSN